MTEEKLGLLKPRLLRRPPSQSGLFKDPSIAWSLRAISVWRSTEEAQRLVERIAGLTDTRSNCINYGATKRLLV
jgi:hypothetical protein